MNAIRMTPAEFAEFERKELSDKKTRKHPKRVKGQQNLIKDVPKKKTASKTLENFLIAFSNGLNLSNDDLETAKNETQSQIKDHGEKLDWMLLIHLIVSIKYGYKYRRHVKLTDKQKFGFDFVVYDKDDKPLCAIEADGGQWIAGGGGHQRGKAWQQNIEDRNGSFLIGVPVYVFVTDHFVKDPFYVVDVLGRVLGEK